MSEPNELDNSNLEGSFSGSEAENEEEPEKIEKVRQRGKNRTYLQLGGQYVDFPTALTQMIAVHADYRLIFEIQLSI